MNKFIEFFDGFNELVQVFLGFAIGLAFSQANLPVGWIFFWIVVWEIGVYLIFGKTKYYNPFFRIVYECIFVISIIVGQYVYYGKTTFQDFLYSNVKSHSGTKYGIMESLEQSLDRLVNGEENSNKKKKLKSRLKNLFSP